MREWLFIPILRVYFDMLTKKRYFVSGVLTLSITCIPIYKYKFEREKKDDKRVDRRKERARVKIEREGQT